MTRKDYRLIADVLRVAYPTGDPNDRDVYLVTRYWRLIVDLMAHELRRTSPYDLNGNRRFDRIRFYQACGVEDPPD